jgi:hypothetical protein
MPRLENRINSDLSKQFRNFASEITSQEAAKPQGTTLIVRGKGQSKVPEHDIRKLWEQCGSSYLHQQASDVTQANMAALLEDIQPGGRPQWLTRNSKENWLSLGSGAALYELFLARLYPNVSITCLDIAPIFQQFNRRLLRQFPELKDRFQYLIGSMSRIESDQAEEGGLNIPATHL